MHNNLYEQKYSQFFHALKEPADTERENNKNLSTIKPNEWTRKVSIFSYLASTRRYSDKIKEMKKINPRRNVSGVPFFLRIDRIIFERKSCSYQRKHIFLFPTWTLPITKVELFRIFSNISEGTSKQGKDYYKSNWTYWIKIFTLTFSGAYRYSEFLRQR